MTAITRRGALRTGTLTALGVGLMGAAGAPLPARLGSDIAADVVTGQPAEPLRPQARYVVEVRGGLPDRAGAPVERYRSSFTTGTPVARARFCIFYVFSFQSQNPRS